MGRMGEGNVAELEYTVQSTSLPLSISLEGQFENLGERANICGHNCFCLQRPSQPAGRLAHTTLVIMYLRLVPSCLTKAPRRGNWCLGPASSVEPGA